MTKTTNKYSPEVRELEQANEILRKASAYFAHEATSRHRFEVVAEELDLPFKR